MRVTGFIAVAITAGFAGGWFAGHQAQSETQALRGYACGYLYGWSDGAHTTPSYLAACAAVRKQASGAGFNPPFNFNY